LGETSNPCFKKFANRPASINIALIDWADHRIDALRNSRVAEGGSALPALMWIGPETSDQRIKEFANRLASVLASPCGKIDSANHRVDGLRNLRIAEGAFVSPGALTESLNTEISAREGTNRERAGNTLKVPDWWKSLTGARVAILSEFGAAVLPLNMRTGVSDERRTRAIFPRDAGSNFPLAVIRLRLQETPTYSSAKISFPVSAYVAREISGRMKVAQSARASRSWPLAWSRRTIE